MEADLPAADCFAHDGEMMTHAEALALLKARLQPVTATQTVPLAQAHGRYLAESITAPRPVPAHTNAAMDGYAFAFADYDPERGARLPVSGRIAAGHPLAEPPKPGTALRIFTGAPMPDPLDTVAMQEVVKISEADGQSWVHLPPGLHQGDNRRLAGEDVAQGEELLGPHRRLRPQDIGAIASTGKGEVQVYRPLEVAVFSTGDEIIRPGTPLAPGQVYDSNAAMLQGLVAATGARCHDLGVLPDDPQKLRAALTEAAGRYHMLITSGGVSLGEEDHVVAIIRELGSLHMWRLAIKPGRPLAFGQMGQALFLGLPGNPVAAYVCFLLYCWPMMVRLGGGDWPEPRRYPLPAAFDIPKKKTGRREFLRGILETDEAGRLVVKKFARDGSGLITSLREAHGLIEIPEDVSQVKRGETVAFLPFGEFGLVM